MQLLATATESSTPFAPAPQPVPSLPLGSVVQEAWEDHGTLQWELRLSQPAKVKGFVGLAVVGYVTGPQPSERQLVLIQPVAKFDTDSGAVVGIARGVEWWEPGTSLYCKVGNTGRAAGVVRREHAIVKVIKLNVRDEVRFCALFIHPPQPPANPPPEHPDDSPPVLKSGINETPTRGVELSDANVGQLSVRQRNQLRSVMQPQNVAGMFPEDLKRVRRCTVRELIIPLNDGKCAPIAVKQQHVSPEEADAVQVEVKKLAGR